MSSLSDVAQVARVSVATASRALSGRGYVSVDARSRVVAAAAQVGYRASAHDDDAEGSRHVTVITQRLDRWTTRAAIGGIASALSDTTLGLALELDRSGTIERIAMQARSDAVILVDTAPSPHEHSLLLALASPVASVGLQVAGIASHTIDHRAAGELAADHLLSLGHTHIVFLGVEGEDGEPASLRRAGFEVAMRRSGVEPERILATQSAGIPGGFSQTLALLADPHTRPAALVAGTDELAIGAIIAARQLGLSVPESLSVIGIDGHELAETFSLTTIGHDPAALGAAAVQQVVCQYENSQATTVAPAALNARSSTRAPRDRL